MLSRLTIMVLAFGLFCSNVSALKLNFDEVKGGDSKAKPFTSLGDNDVSGIAASEWYFKNANVSGGEGIKDADVSENEKSSYTFTIEGNNFNFVTFTIALSGDITKHGGSGGTMPTYSLTGRRDGELYIEPVEAVIPAGGSITFYGKEKFLKVVDPTGAKECNWALQPVTYKVAGEDYTPDPVYLVESTTCPISPSSNYKTPDPGSYTVKAKASPSSEAEWKTATLKVVSAEFKKHASHQYGFDDYTNFTKKPQYPSRTDYTFRCTNPYIACPTNTVTYTTLGLDPTPITPAESDITGSSGVTLSPVSMTASGAVTFNTSGNANIKSNLKGQTLNELGIYTYNLIQKNCLIVLVGRPDGLGGYTYPSIHRSCSKIPSTFLQCLIQVNIAEPLAFPYPGHIGSPYEWTQSNRHQLMACFIVNTPISLINFQIIQFIIHENDVAPTITGWGEFPGTYSWVYSGHNGAATSPHEIAHNLGADDSSDADDGYNLMFSSGQHTTLRKFQWEEIR